MADPTTLSRAQLIDRLLRKETQLLQKDDVIGQLEQKHKELELAYAKLWRERFEARSERYIVAEVPENDKECETHGEKTLLPDSMWDRTETLEFERPKLKVRVTVYPKTLPEFDLEDPKQRRIHEVFTKALNENKPSIRARMWAYRGANVKLNVFDFTVSRHRDGPELFFANYRGTLPVLREFRTILFFGPLAQGL